VLVFRAFDYSTKYYLNDYFLKKRTAVRVPKTRYEWPPETLWLIFTKTHHKLELGHTIPDNVV